MTSDQLASMYAEIVQGTAKIASRFCDADGFSTLWDKISGEVAAIRAKDPHAKFDVPSEIAG